jgi:CRISPR-associated protein Cmr6
MSYQDARRKRLQEIPFYRDYHAGLWLDKFLVTSNSDVDLEDNTKQPVIKEKARSRLVRQVSELNEPQQYKIFFARWREQLQEMGAILYEATTLGRLSIGLGSASVIETSVSIHRTYGVPYIPGSALKGVAVHYAHQYHKKVWGKGTDAHKTLFGTTDSAGYVTFLDALPLPSEWQLHQDTITVHHPEYYQGLDKAPADWDSPNPVPFLSVSGKFLIALHAPDAPEWGKRGMQILQRALANVGVGAKTSSGYGRFMDELGENEPEEGGEMGEAEVSKEAQNITQLRQEIKQLKPDAVASQSRALYQVWKTIDPPNGALAGALLEKMQTAKIYKKKWVNEEWVQELINCATR